LLELVSRHSDQNDLYIWLGSEVFQRSTPNIIMNYDSCYRCLS
jgi:hypothetical protein